MSNGTLTTTTISGTTCTDVTAGWDPGLEICYCEHANFFKYVPTKQQGCCTCNLTWVDSVGSFLDVSSFMFIILWMIAFVFLSLNLRQAIRDESQHYKLFIVLTFLCTFRIVFWLDCNGMRGIIAGGIQHLVHYVGLAIVIIVNVELILLYEQSMLYVKETSQNRIRKCETMSKLATGVVLLILTVLGVYCYVAYFVLQTIEFILWYTLYVRVWRYILGSTLVICALFMVFESTTFRIKFEKQKRMQEDAVKHIRQKIRKSLMSGPKEDGGKNFRKIRQSKRSLRRHQSVATPAYIVNQNKFLTIFGASEIFTFATAIIITTLARGDPIAYMVELTLIDTTMVLMTFWVAFHFMEAKHITANFPCLGCRENSPGESHGRSESRDDRRSISENQRRKKRSTRGKNLGQTDNTETKRSSRKFNRKSKLKKTVSSIDRVSVEDVNETNFEDILEVVLNMASKECKEVENGDHFNSESDAASEETASDDSSEFDEEYSFDNVRRVELTNRGRRVSIYDMEFDDDLTEGSGVNA